MSGVDELDLPLSKEQLTNISLFTDEEKRQESTYLSENIMAEKKLVLRKGTVVMCIANLDIENGLINGSQGIVVDFQNNNPVIKFKDGKIQQITPHVWQSEKIPGIAVKQLPLIYAWAITIHKAQGVTLDNAYIDIGNDIFECGQSYVALSRVKSLDGLYLKILILLKSKLIKKFKNFMNH